MPSPPPTADDTAADADADTDAATDTGTDTGTAAAGEGAGGAGTGAGRQPDRRGRPGPTARLALLFGAMTACWILLMPPAAGPDEPNHIIRSAALVRGDYEGSPIEGAGRQHVFDVPAWVGTPAPDCWKHQEFVPVTCATSAPAVDPDADVVMRLTSYPIWGYVLPGIGTLIDSRDPSWYLSRALDAAPAVALAVGALALARRRGPLASAGVLLAMTPMAWFSFAVINPSGPAIAGGIALWAALMYHPPPQPSDDDDTPVSGTVWRAPRAIGWLAALAFAAVVLTRRDGPVWAGWILALPVLVANDSLLARWRWIGRGPQMVVVASTAAAATWLIVRGEAYAAGATGLLLPFAAVAVRWAWDRMADQPLLRGVVAVTAGVGATGAAIHLASRYGQGGVFPVDLFRKLVVESGINIQQAVGSLGWLDTPVPLTAQYVYFILLGGLVAVAWMSRSNLALMLATAVVVASVISAWIMELGQGGSSGVYWQGRYYLPLLAGVPIALGMWRARTIAEGDRLGRAAVVGALAVTNFALFAAVRRFGVGTLGQLLPWEWDTYGTPLPVVVLLGAHLLLSAGLARELVR